MWQAIKTHVLGHKLIPAEEQERKVIQEVVGFSLEV